MNGKDKVDFDSDEENDEGIENEDDNEFDSIPI